MVNEVDRAELAERGSFFSPVIDPDAEHSLGELPRSAVSIFQSPPGVFTRFVLIAFTPGDFRILRTGRDY